MDKTIRVWSLVEDNEILKMECNFVCCVAYSPDGNFIASGSYDKTIKIWNLADWNET